MTRHSVSSLCPVFRHARYFGNKLVFIISFSCRVCNRICSFDILFDIICTASEQFSVLTSLTSVGIGPSAQRNGAQHTSVLGFAQGGVIYVLDKSRLSIRLQALYSEERREKRARAQGKPGSRAERNNVTVRGDKRSKCRVCIRCFDRKYIREYSGIVLNFIYEDECCKLRYSAI